MDSFVIGVKRTGELTASLSFEKSSCPRCGSGSFIKHGRTRLGRQRYRCRECRKTFSETTGTPFMYSKKTLDDWAGYLFCMEGGLTLRKISVLLGMNLSTAFAWRHKILSVCGTMTDTLLTETVEVSEFWLKENFKGCRKMNPHFRDWNNRWVILFMSCVDSRENILFRAAARKGMRKLDNEEVSCVLGPVVRRCKTIVTTSNLSYVAFAKKHKVKLCMPYSSNYVVKGFGLKNAEKQAWGFKEFLRGFRSVASKYLSHYVNWYRLLLKRGASLAAEIMSMISSRGRKLRVYEFGKVQFDGSFVRE